MPTSLERRTGHLPWGSPRLLQAPPGPFRRMTAVPGHESGESGNRLQPRAFRLYERRGRDSNPRWTNHAHNGFRDFRTMVSMTIASRPRTDRSPRRPKPASTAPRHTPRGARDSRATVGTGSRAVECGRPAVETPNPERSPALGWGGGHMYYI